MSFQDMLRQKFKVKKPETKSRAKSIEEQITSAIENQLDMIMGKTVLGANGKPMKSWRNSKGEVAIKIGVLPMFLDSDGKMETYENVSEEQYADLVRDLKYSYNNDELVDIVANLKERKAAADKKAAAQRAENKKKKTENRDGLS